MHLQYQRVISDMKKHAENMKKQIEMEQKLMQDEINHSNSELEALKKKKEEDSNTLHLVIGEKQSLEESLSKLQDKYKERESLLEKSLAQRSYLKRKLIENHEDHIRQLQQVTKQRDQLHDDITALIGDCHAKTQQVDSLLLEVQDSRVKLSENEKQIQHYKEQIRKLREDEKLKVCCLSWILNF